MMSHALIVDDNAENLEVLARLLGANDVSYTAIQDPTDIPAVLDREDHVDMVFLDLEMPKRNGYELLDVIRAQYGTKAQIIACTVHTSEIDHAHEAGFDGFISKPLNPTQFAKQLKQIQNKIPVWDAS